MEVDVLALGAHPDDVELSIGGTVAKLVDRGRSVVIADLTRGEIGSRGSPETRAEEAEKAARVLGVAERVNLDLGDGALQDNLENRSRLVGLIREFRPAIILANHWNDLHPDHMAAGLLIRSVMYASGFLRYPAEGEPFRTREVFFYMAHLPFEPALVVDISAYHDKKMEAIGCYASQLHRTGDDELVTNISKPDFLLRLESRARHYGGLIGVEFGEPFAMLRPVPVSDPAALFLPSDDQ